ncbi:hypothetical protein GCM10011492_17620 [Flexivirga endophytica]|uniref:Uncharacterized protein n=1 Tax=Flexivirga endophytica TaxID=1849103 RepID=A0A916T1F8_9MICO|nr:hypothetical protein [Flexivirga endophytica]GGB27869.1 hypothetical protein GCM10011492_17620 [Flexivirga endophytica]GHB61696.1 hypothetical protein GCM10008112_33310 [Flexivirga endophytica]
MWRLIQYAAVCVAPAALLVAADKAVHHWIMPRPAKRRGPSPVPRDIGRLSADLTRLYAELDVLRSSQAAARVHRLRATTLAYDDVLESCCTALQVDDGLPPREWSSVERLEVEATLEEAGLRW